MFRECPNIGGCVAVARILLHYPGDEVDELIATGIKVNETNDELIRCSCVGTISYMCTPTTESLSSTEMLS